MIDIANPGNPPVVVESEKLFIVFSIITMTYKKTRTGCLDCKARKVKVVDSRRPRWTCAHKFGSATRRFLAVHVLEEERNAVSKLEAGHPAADCTPQRARYSTRYRLSPRRVFNVLPHRLQTDWQHRTGSY